MSIRRLFARLLTRRTTGLESGQALAEYMPTIAGFFALSAVVAWAFQPALSDAYCQIVDTVTDPPGVCETDDGGDVTDDTDPIEDPDQENEPEASCVITLTGEDGTDPADWSGPWDGGDDTLIVEVVELDETIPWTLTRSFPTDPDIAPEVIGSGEIPPGDGTHEITVSYPAAGEWGDVSDEGDGTYRAEVALDITTPCGAVNWNRWYEAEAAADLGIAIDHATSPLTVNGEALTYTVTVTNHGPYAVEVVDDQGAIVDLPVPAGVTVTNVTPSKGECEDTVTCDLGAMALGETATITVETTVGNVVTCALDATSTVSSVSPVDPDLSNNEASTSPFCELTCEQNVSGLNLIDADTNTVISPISDGAEFTLVEGDAINIEALVSGDVGSVEFLVNGSSVQTENTAPYALAGDSNGNFSAWNWSPGSYTVTARPYTQSNRNGETCSDYTVNFTIIQEDAPDTPGGINDPDQPHDDWQATCPEGYESQAVYDHYATPGNPKLAIQWQRKDVDCKFNCGRQAHTYNFDIGGNWDTVLVMRGAVGHPEEGCPEGDHIYCGWENQDNEHWAVDIDGERVAFNPDNYALDHVYMSYPDAELGVLSPGTYEIRMYHPGLLDQPANSSGPSVGAFVRVCVQK